MKKIVSIFVNPFISPIIISAAIVLFLMVCVIPDLSHENELKSLEKQALATTTKIRKVRSYYTTNIVSKIKNLDNVKINFDHYSQKDTIPLPATLLHDLSEILPQDGITLKMFSHYPFPNRANRVLSKSEESGLAFVEKNPNKVYTEIVKEKNQDVLKVTVADIFYEQSCVKCHNTRADTPKNDWSIGDVRGALQVSLPIQNGIKLTTKQTLVIFSILMLLVLILGLHYSIVAYKNKKTLSIHNDLLDKKINERTKTLNEYKKAVDHSAIVSKTDKNGTITYVNDQFTKISQYEAEELIGKNHNLIRDPNMPDEVFSDLWRTIKAKKVWRGEISNRAKDGTIYYVSSTIIPILNSKDEIEEFLAVRLDVSDIVKSKLEAQRANNVKSTFLANISHEIRTPLNAIIGFTQVLNSSETLPVENKKQVEIINSSAHNLLGIINDILDISKIENGNFDISIEDTDIHFIAEHVTELFSQRSSQKDISFIFNIDKEIPHCIQTDGVRIRQVVSNLLGNSIKFTQRGGEVTFNIRLIPATNEKKIKIRFEVIDNGIGIDINSQQKVFEPFVQADDNSNRKYEGTGLGLSICNYIVKALDSKIGLESKVNEGSKFWFDLELESCDETFFLKENYVKELGFFIDDQTTWMAQHIEKYILTLGSYVTQNIDVILITNSDNLQKLRESYPAVPKLLFLRKENQLQNIQLATNEYAITLPFYLSKIDEKLDQIMNYTNEESHQSQISYDRVDAHILVAEDNEANQELIKYILEELDIKYTIVSNGEEAVTEYKKEKFNLVLMDINMPIMDGIDAFKNIREYEATHNLLQTPIVALTANAIKGDKEKFLSLGMNEYLSKPLQIEKLQNVFDKYLKKTNEIEKKEKESIKVNVQAAENNSVQQTLDAATIASKLGVSESIGALLIKKFKERIVKDLDELEKYIEANDFNEISSKAHFIKNSCLNLGLEDICKQLQEIETNIKDTEELFIAFKELKNSINSFL